MTSHYRFRLHVLSHYWFRLHVLAVMAELIKLDAPHPFDMNAFRFTGTALKEVITTCLIISAVAL